MGVWIRRTIHSYSIGDKMFELSNGILKINNAFAVNLREVITIWHEDSATPDNIDLCFMDWEDGICRITLKLSDNDFIHEYTDLYYEWESIMHDAGMEDIIEEMKKSRQSDNGNTPEKIDLSNEKG